MSDLKLYLSKFGSRARNNQIHENQSVRGDYKIKSGQIYLRVMASWVWLRAQSLRTISIGSFTGDKTSIWNQPHGLIGLCHVTAGNPSSSRIGIAIVWQALNGRFLTGWSLVSGWTSRSRITSVTLSTWCPRWTRCSCNSLFSLWSSWTRLARWSSVSSRAWNPSTTNETSAWWMTGNYCMFGWEDQLYVRN